MLGCTADALIGCRLDGVVQEAEPVRALLTQTALGLHSHCEEVFPRSAGKSTSLGLTARPILDEQGQPSSTLVTFARCESAAGGDAAAIKEEHFHALFESIDQSVSILEILFDESDVAIDYRFVAVNRAHHAMCGVGPEAVGKRISEVMPDIDPAVIQRLGKVALTGEPARFEQFIRPLDRCYEVYLCSRTATRCGPVPPIWTEWRPCPAAKNVGFRGSYRPVPA